MIEEFVFQIALVALVVAMWIDIARLHKKINVLDAYVRYMYYLLYYQYYSQAQPSKEEEEKEEDEATVVGSEVILGDVDKVKESCVLELISRRGCVDIEEVAALCNASKFFIRQLYRKKKVVKIDREGRVCPRE